MSTTIGIDPGNTTGYAVFHGTRLVTGGALSRRDLLRNLPLPLSTPIGVFVELPRVYPLSSSKGDPNQIVDLAALAGKIAGWYEGHRGASTRLVTPREWKGSVPKAIHQGRIVAALTPEERGVLPRRPRAQDYDHNMIDAVGIGLWALKKERRR